jgi:hypothetical protein
MRLLKYIHENLKDTEDFGATGRKFEAEFVKALEKLDVDHKANVASGAGWDIKSKGPDWVKLLMDKEINLKIFSAKWMFGSTDLTKMLPWDKPDEKFDKEKMEMRVKRYLNKKGLSDITFLKPKTADIQATILKAVRTEDIEKLKEVMVKKNFQFEKLGRTYDVRILQKKDGTVSSVAIDKGGKVFMRGEKPRKMGGSMLVAFKAPTNKLSKVDKTIIKK